MLILGIDPGIERTGWGVVMCDGAHRALDYGCVMTDKGEALSSRLDKIYIAIGKIIERYEPDVVAVEEIFFAKNAKSAITVGHARGVLLLLCGQKGVPLEEVTPLQVKSTMVGYGKATKEQVGLTVKEVLGLQRLPRPDDVCDALAIAITAGIQKSFNAKLASASSYTPAKTDAKKAKI